MKAFVIATLFVVSCTASYHGAISTQFQAQDGHGGYSYGYSDPLSSKHETKSHDGTLHGGYSYVDAHGHVQSVKYIADAHNGFQVVAATNLPKGPAPAIAVAPVAYHAAPVAYHAAPVVAYHSAPAVSHWGHHAYAPLAHGAPLPVQKTPEVVAAEHAHFAAVAEAKARLHHHHKRSAYGYAPAPVNGVPVDTPEVQHEKAQHFAAVQRALAGQPANPLVYGHGAPAHYAAPAHYSAPAYNHYAHAAAPAPVNGVPQDTAEVAHEKAKHLALVAEAKSKIGYGGHYAAAPAHYAAPAYNHYGYAAAPAPVHGVPQDTAEVAHAKANHFALVAEAKAKSSYAPSYYGHEDDGSYDARRYESEYHH